MIEFTIIVACVILSSVTGVIAYHRWSDEIAKDAINVIPPIFATVFWPITLTVYITKGVINTPERRRQKDANKRELAQQIELDQAKHETALARERAAQAEADNRVYRAHGMPNVPGT